MFRLNLLFASLILLLNACSSDDANAKGIGKEKGKNEKPNRSYAVEGYVAKAHTAKREFETMATLEAKNSIELSVLTSGVLKNIMARDGALVRKGTLLAKIDDAELQAQMKQAKAEAKLAEQKLLRTQKLYEQGSATQADLESAEAVFKSSEASIELLKAKISKTEVRAPFDGRLGFVNVSLGAYLTTGNSITTLSEVKTLKAKFSVPQRYATMLKAGDAVTLRDEERGIERKGSVLTLDATLSESSRTRQVLVTVDNAKGDLLAGSYAKIKIALESKGVNTIPVPAEALTLDKDGAYLYVYENGVAKTRHVTTGLRTPISVDILSGLSEGDTVITSGLISIREGTSVRIKEIRNNTDYEVN